MRSIASTTRVALVAGVSMIGLLASTAAWAQVEGDTGKASAATTENTGIAEIVVTATRSAQNLQSVPVAVSAFTGAALEEQQITNTSKLIQSIPNTTFTKGNFTGANLTIRGVGAPVVSGSGDTGVGIHVNDMPIVAPRLFETEFYDMQRIEVLRGPQGTLFGRNATAGVMNLIPNKASTKGLDAFGEFEYGNYNSIKVTGMFNYAINDKLAVRVAGLYVNRDGYVTNLYNDTQIDGRNSYSIRGSIHYEPTDALTIDLMGSYFSEDSDRMRIQKQYCIRDATAVLGCQPNGLAAQHTNGNSTLASILTSTEFLRIAAPGLGAAIPGLAFGSVYQANDTFSGSFVTDDPFEVETQYQPTYKSDELILMANIEYAFEKGTLSIIGGYDKNMVDSRADYSLAVNNVQTTIPTNIATLNAAFPGQGKASLNFQGGNLCISEANTNFVGFIGGQNYACNTNRQMQYDRSTAWTSQWSGEVHFESKLDGMFNFLLGGNYLSFNSSGDFYVVASGLDYASTLLGAAGPGPGGVASPYYDNRVENYDLSTYAFFGEAYLQFKDNLKLTGGLRWTSTTKDVQDNQPQPLYNYGYTAGGTQAVPDALRKYRFATVDESEWTGRIVLEWTPTLNFTDSTLLYASYSRGYKSGGINPSFDPSVVAGAKTAYEPEFINAYEIGMKNRLLDGTLQANLTGFYYDYQGLQISRIIARSSFNDNTNATIYGLEAEFIMQPIPALQFTAALSYLHTSINDLSISDSRDPSGGRSDVVIIKDITNASNCAVIPTVVGGPRADGLVNAVNASVGLKPVTPIGGTNTVGAFSICSALAGQIKAGGLPFQYVQNANGTVNLPDGAAVSLDGNQLAQSPEFKMALGAQYNFDINESMGGYFQINYNFTGNQYGRNYNTFADRIDSYGILNAQVQLNGGNGKWYVRGFIQNITDSNAITGMYLTDASSALFTNVFTVDPRRFGAAIGFHFN